MSLITTNERRIVLKKAESMMVVPYVYDSGVGDYVLGNDVYDISAVIGDSITIEQEEGETDAKYNEFKASPLVESVSGAKYKFTAQCVDMQDAVLKSLFGAMTVSGVDGAAAFNDDHVQLFCMIRVRFKDGSLPDVILPKVQMNSKLFVNQLKTRLSQGNISGTALSRKVAVDNTSHTMALPFTSISAQSSVYAPLTPVLLAPKSLRSMVFRNASSGVIGRYSVVNFNTGIVTTLLLNESNGHFVAPGEEGGEGGSGEGGEVGGGGA